MTFTFHLLFNTISTISIETILLTNITVLIHFFAIGLSFSVVIK